MEEGLHGGVAGVVCEGEVFATGVFREVLKPTDYLTNFDNSLFESLAKRFFVNSPICFGGERLYTKCNRPQLPGNLWEYIHLSKCYRHNR